MKLYREENIKKIIDAIELDEYDDSEQDKVVEQDDFLPEVKMFLQLFVKPGNVLEIGCGSGDSMNLYGITHGVEPCKKRYESALSKKLLVKRNVVEYLEFDNDFFDSALMLNGWFQVRSDYEAMIEVNRVLKLGGYFIFNLLVNDELDIVLGRCLGPNNYIRLTEQFGFKLIAQKKYNAGNRFYPPIQEGVVFCFEKIRDFDNRWLNLLQADIKSLKNYLPERDWRLI